MVALTLGDACVSLHDQLFGRAGRDGRASRAHIFLSSAQKCSEQVRGYCTSKENCRRRMMLLAVGASENHPENLPCCDSCNNSKCPKSVCFESQVTSTRSKHKRRIAVKDVNDNCMANLRAGLVKAVEEFLEEHPSFKMLGRSFICPDSVIEKICAEARFINSLEDLNIVGIRPEIKSSLYHVVSSVISNAPARKRSRRV